MNGGVHPHTDEMRDEHLRLVRWARLTAEGEYPCQMRLFPLLLLISHAKASFFDVCPANRQSIGECLAGLCPAGTKCINNHCCIPTNTRKFTTHRRRQPLIDANLITDIEKIRQKKGGQCFVRGNEPIGVCLGNDICPTGYTCENDSCCNIEEGRRLRSRKKKTQASAEEELTEEEEDLIERGRAGEEEEEEEEEEENGDQDEEDEADEEDDEKSLERKESGEDEDVISEEEEQEEAIEDSDMIRANRMGFRRYKAKRKPNKIPEAEEIEEQSAVLETKNVCPIGFPIGECVSRLCPDGYSCYKNSCCAITPEINCEDSLPKCHSYLCDIDGYSEFMSQFCPKTCAKCTTSKSTHRQSSKKPVVTTTATPFYGNYRGPQSEIRSEMCTDRRSDCVEWANSGFCTSTIYSTAQKMRFCGRSCGYC